MTTGNVQSGHGPRGDGATLANQVVPLRFWPVLVLVPLMWGCLRIPFLLPLNMMFFMVAMFGPFVCYGLLALWWLFYSKARLSESASGLVAGLAVAVVITLFIHPSMQGMGLLFNPVPWGVTAYAGALALFYRAARRVPLALFSLALALGYWTLIRSDGLSGDFQSELAWRWTPTAEDKFLAQIQQKKARTPTDSKPADPEPTGSQPADTSSPSTNEPAPSRAALSESPTGVWPGFRGAERTGVVPGVALAPSWTKVGPKQVWSRLVGPGWSSFAVLGGKVVTQEQRGQEEAVVCLEANTGEPVWSHTVTTRFWEAVGGAGPRGTPTLHDGRVYSLGANGHLSCLELATGELHWERDLSRDAERKPPEWGFSASPLVVGNRVIVHAGGKGDLGVFAYDLEKGNIAWKASAGDHSYSSLQVLRLRDVEAVVCATNTGVHAFEPDSGTLVWEYKWPSAGYRVLQPLRLDDRSFVVADPLGMQSRRLTLDEDGKTVSLTWTSQELRPDFCDMVVHKGYIYGFDQKILTCVDASTGKRKWKKGRFGGSGQLLLLPDADQLLVLGETGEIVLVNAIPDDYQERARVPVLTGKTWNHPVLVHDRLYVRNAEQAACYVLPLADASAEKATDTPSQRE